MLAWIKKYSRNQKVSYRAFSLHISLALLQRFADFPADSDLRQTSASLLVAIVTGRLQDKSPSVRAHALECLADLLDLAGGCCRCLLGLSHRCPSTLILHKSHLFQPQPPSRRCRRRCLRRWRSRAAAR